MRYLIVSFLYIAAIVCLCSGCKSKESTLYCPQTSKKDLNGPIMVGFYKGMIETSVGITEENMIERMQDSVISDTIIVDNNDFDFLISHACYFSTKGIVCRDARIILQYKDFNICLGDLTYKENKHLRRKDIERLLYYSYCLKKDIGYYNYIMPEDLKYQYELKKHEIPVNYKYIYDDYTTTAVTDKIERIIDGIDGGDFKKIIILPQQNQRNGL